jgi:hypothetical protein
MSCRSRAVIARSMPFSSASEQSLHDGSPVPVLPKLQENVGIERDFH